MKALLKEYSATRLKIYQQQKKQRKTTELQTSVVAKLLETKVENRWIKYLDEFVFIEYNFSLQVGKIFCHKPDKFLFKGN